MQIDLNVLVFMVNYNSGKSRIENVQIPMLYSTWGDWFYLFKHACNFHRTGVTSHQPILLREYLQKLLLN